MLILSKYQIILQVAVCGYITKSIVTASKFVSQNKYNLNEKIYNNRIPIRKFSTLPNTMEITLKKQKQYYF